MTTTKPARALSKLNWTAEILMTVRGKQRWVVIARCADQHVAHAAIQLRDEARRICKAGEVWLAWNAREAMQATAH